jgi:PAS domain S-box-containing protein
VDGKVVGIRSTATDITERKLVEEALRESEERFRTLVETMRDGLGVQDENGLITYVNERACELSGYSREELIGRPAMELIDEPDREIFAEEFSRRQRGEAHSYEVKWIGKGGRKIAAIVSSAPIVDAEGKFEGSFAVITDITARKRSEEALRESEERYRAVVDTQTDLVCRFLPDGTLTFVNEAICRFLGRKREEIIGQSFYQYVHPDDREETRRNLESLSVENPLGMNEEKVILPSGEHRWLEWKNQALFDDGGRFIEFQAVGRDTTEHKAAVEKLRASEERHRLLLEASPDPIVVYDIDGCATYVNTAFVNTFGWSSRELLGKRIDFVPEENWPETRVAIDRMLQGEKIQSFETRRMTKQGKILDIQISSSLFSDAGGEPTGNIVILRDVSERKKVEDALRRREADLEAQSRHLEEVNAALRVLLKQREQDKGELEEKVLSNVKKLVLPYVRRLKNSRLDAEQAAYLGILQSNLEDIVSPFATRLSSSYLRLTPAEIEVANLIKEARDTKTIAELLNISPRTVDSHRQNIRKKLGLRNRKANLRTHLLSIH